MTREFISITYVSRILSSINSFLSPATLVAPPTTPEVVLHEKRAEIGFATMTMLLMSCEGVDREEKDIIDEMRDVQTSDVLLRYWLIERF
jgi:hypothetical protein